MLNKPESQIGLFAKRDGLHIIHRRFWKIDAQTRQPIKGGEILRRCTIFFQWRSMSCSLIFPFASIAPDMVSTLQGPLCLWETIFQREF